MNMQERVEDDSTVVLTVIFLALSMFLVLAVSLLFIPTSTQEEKVVQKTVYVKDAKVSQKEVAGEILLRSIESGIAPCDAVKIALCESNIQERAKNTGSTAKGVYQFIDSTWDNYCQGDVYNHQDNIECFMNLYPQQADWWECKA